MNAALPPSFWAKVDKTDTCWLWTGARTSRGYGQFFTQGVSKSVHRLVLTDIPAGLTVDHLCRVKHCCNPAHLEVVTQAENNRRKPECQVTECPKGHPYDEANTLLKGARRSCRECQNARRRVPDELRQRRVGTGDRRLRANRVQAGAA